MSTILGILSVWIFFGTILLGLFLEFLSEPFSLKQKLFLVLCGPIGLLLITTGGKWDE